MFYFIILPIVLLTILWGWYTAPTVLPSIAFPGKHTHTDNQILESPRIKSPDVLRPRIQLHPENHMYRDPVTQYKNWTVTAGSLRPDGVLKQVYLINGIFPGPTLEARSGDVLMINVSNQLQDESFTIHWHGLHIENPMDGVASVTQSTISPGSSFTYKIAIPSDQSGTFWYHAHAGLARADGLYGGFIVHPAASKSTVRGLMSRERRKDADPEKNVLLLIGDWYHRPAAQVMAWYMRAGSFGNEPVPDSLLVNGLGYFDCPMAVPARPVDCVHHPISLSQMVPADNTYRLRIVNTGSLAGLKLTFDNHDVTVLAVDSMPVEVQDGQSAGILYPGQRMDLRIRQISKNKQSLLTIHLDEECFRYPNPALTSIQTFNMSEPSVSAQEPARVSSLERASDQGARPSFIDIQDLPSAEHVLSRLPQTATVNTTEVVYTKIQKLSIRHNVPYGFFNRTSWLPQADPPIALINLQRDKWDKNQFGITVNVPHETGTSHDADWVDLVVNNLDDGGHPFHLHGHHFYILAVHQASIGWGSYNPFTDNAPPGLDPESFSQTNGYDLSRAMYRDTVYIPSRAYAVLRFKADNIGVWMFHCHILWHLASGMAMLIDVMPATDVRSSTYNVL
ncbi:multicopper oxidase-domain-containing protein [Aspergillus ambiguus]|uniref:multicopper oxidase family protein n=1 Tax=Aspergillus ambiguus TaxID=176160 RepID=UPI003CCE34F9